MKKRTQKASPLDGLFRFKVGDIVQPVSYQVPTDSYSIFEVRYHIVERHLRETSAGIRRFYQVRAVTRECKVVNEYILLDEIEIMRAEPFTKKGEWRRKN